MTSLQYMISWTLFVVVVVVAFFALEIPGVANKERRMDTLTENLRLWFGFSPRRWYLQVLGVMLIIGGPVALLIHLFGAI